MPVFEHDCDDCTFLGTSTCDGERVDVYEACTKSSYPFIVRFSSEGSDYCTVCENSRFMPLCRMVQGQRIMTDLHRAGQVKSRLESELSIIKDKITALDNKLEQHQDKYSPHINGYIKG